jgi:hypothetical protein
VALVRIAVLEEHITSIIRVEGISELKLLQLLVTANVVPGSLILSTQKM